MIRGDISLGEDKSRLISVEQTSSVTCFNSRDVQTFTYRRVDAAQVNIGPVIRAIIVKSKMIHELHDVSRTFVIVFIVTNGVGVSVEV